MTDHQLLERIQSRDAQAQSDLYDRYGRLVYGFVLGIVRDTDEAEDIVQDVFVRIWNKAATWQPDAGNPKNWIIRIAHNRALNVLRSTRVRAKQSELSLSDESVSESGKLSSQLAEESLWENAVNDDHSAHMSSALQSLPSEQRALIDLAFFHGYSHSEIAELTGVPLGTVKTRIRTGLLALRSRLEYLKDNLS